MPKYFLSALLFIASCSTNVTSLKKDVDILSDPEYGYLLLGVDTERRLHELEIKGEKNIKFSSDDLMKGENYLLINLPAGQYNISKIRVDNYLYFKLEKENWTFDINNNVISYAGDINIDLLPFWQLFRGTLLHQNFSADIELENKSSFALEFLERNYPQILESRRVVYKGPGEDSFLDFVQNK